MQRFMRGSGLTEWRRRRWLGWGLAGLILMIAGCGAPADAFPPESPLATASPSIASPNSFNPSNSSQTPRFNWRTSGPNALGAPPPAQVAIAPAARTPTPALEATVPTEPTPIPASGTPLCGTWAMLQVSNTRALQFFSGAVHQALAIPGVSGLSLRAPWTAITSNLDIFQAGVQLAQASNSALAIRFISGISTPPQYLGNSVVMAGTGGMLIPLPWGPGTTPTSFKPNTTFESAYAATVRELAAFARANGIHELHLPWYSGSTAEIYNGPEVQSAPGYSLQNFLTGYERLLDIGMSVAGPDLTVEYPVGGTDVGAVVQPLERYIVSTFGAFPNLILQWNDLVNNGPQISAPWIYTGRQMNDQGNYDWPSVYQVMRSEGSLTLEVYLQSFDPSLSGAAQLRQQIAAFAATC